MTSILLSLALVPGAAAAPPAWSWVPGKAVKYHLETEIYTPRGYRYNARRNLDAIATHVHTVVDAECTPAASGKNWVVTCTLAFVGIEGTGATRDDHEEMPTILQEWSADLLPARVELVVGRDGRLREFDLKGISGDEKRSNYIVEQQRTLLQRTFAPFDFPITTSDDDWKRGWVQKSGALLQLQTVAGTAGTGEITHTPQGQDQGLWSILTAGKAILTPSAALDTDGAALIDVRVVGTTLFDAGLGLIEYRDVSLEGRRTASSVEVGSDADYFQVSAIQRVDAFLPGGAAPPSVAAARAPKVDAVVPEVPAGQALVPYAELGMEPLYIPQMPPDARAMRLPTSAVEARVFVGADGVPTSVVVTKGLTVLAEPARQALTGARFPARGQPYVVDVSVEFRSEDK